MANFIFTNSSNFIWVNDIRQFLWRDLVAKAKFVVNAISKAFVVKSTDKEFYSD